MTIWTRNNHTRHPWFDNAVKKRKQRHCGWEWATSSDDSDESEARPTKRRRCDGLEQGLADLSLHHKPPRGHTPFPGDEPPKIMEVPQEEEMPVVDVDDRVGGHSLGEDSVVLPSSVEEPELDIPEIEMKTSSWYELTPDRIVITDLDSYELEDENEGGDSGAVSVNTPLLEHIKKQWAFMANEVIQPQTNQALVLFRPLTTPGIERLEQQTRAKETGNEYKMDVEP